MSAFGRFLERLFGTGQPEPTKSAPKETTPRPRSRYDSAQTGKENENHWLQADALSANAANSLAVRTVLRNRSRYERANNSYAKGLIAQRTIDTIGTGPRLQLELPEEFTDPDFQVAQTTGTAQTPDPNDLARQVERKWCEWVEATGFYDKLRVMADAEDGDGEGLALFIDNPDIAERTGGITLDLRVIECDRCMTPDLITENAMRIDGIHLDVRGNPVAYDVLQHHPGDVFVLGRSAQLWKYDTIPARNVIHLFEQDRPEQKRGIPILTPSLGLYAYMRRFTLAVVGAAELAAMIAGVIESESGPMSDLGTEAPDIDAMDQIPFARGGLMTLYGGQKAKAFNPSQPAPGYSEFKAEVLSEAGRATGAPRNVSTANSAVYNFASGRLDLLPYHRGIRCRRERYDRHLLDRVYYRWLEEAQGIPGYLPAGLPPVEEWEWEWRWDGFDFIDPLKEANANRELLDSGQTTLKRVCAERGEHWVDVIKQRGREKKMLDAEGLTPVQPSTPAPPIPEDPSGVPVGATVTLGDSAVHVGSPVTTIHMPEQPAPVTTVNFPTQPAPVVTVEPGNVTVNVPENPAPVVHAPVTINNPEQPAPVVHVEPATVTVNMPEQQAPTITVVVPQPKKTTRQVVRGDDKLIRETVETHEY